MTRCDIDVPRATISASDGTGKSHVSEIVGAFSDMGGTTPQHLGGPDDLHYAVLDVQPIEVIEAWSPTWPGGVSYHVGEALAAIARCGTKGQAERDLRKASWLLSRAADVLSGKTACPRAPDTSAKRTGCQCHKCKGA